MMKENNDISTSSNSQAECSSCSSCSSLSCQPYHKPLPDGKEIKVEAVTTLPSMSVAVKNKNVAATCLYSFKQLKKISGLVEVDHNLLLAAKCFKNSNPQQAEKLLLLAAKNCSSIAADKLGDYYFFKEENYAKALKWYTQAAKQHNADSYFSLGNCYYFGLGVKQSYREAYRWFLKAAIMLHPLALYGMFLCYKNGEGVGENVVVALKWLNSALNNHFDPVEGLLRQGLCYYSGGEGLMPSITQALASFKLAYAQARNEADSLRTLQHLCVCYPLVIKTADNSERKRVLLMEYYAWFYRALLLSIKLYKKRFIKAQRIISIITLQDYKFFLGSYLHKSAAEHITELTFELLAFYDFVTSGTSPAITLAQTTSLNEIAKNYGLSSTQISVKHALVLDEAQLALLSIILDSYAEDINSKTELRTLVEMFQCGLLNASAISLREFKCYWEINLEKIHEQIISRPSKEHNLSTIDARLGTEIASFLYFHDMLQLSSVSKWWRQTLFQYDRRWGIVADLVTARHKCSIPSYISFTLIELGLVALIWYACNDKNSWPTRLLAGFLVLPLIWLGRKNRSAYQQNNWGIFNNKREHSLSSALCNGKSLLKDIYLKIGQINQFIMAGSKAFKEIKFSTVSATFWRADDVLLLKNLYDNCTNFVDDLIVTKKLAVKFAVLLNVLAECIPKQATAVFPDKIQNDLKLLSDARITVKPLLGMGIYSHVDEMLQESDVLIKGLAKLVKLDASSISQVSCSTSSMSSAEAAVISSVPSLSIAEGIWNNFAEKFLEQNAKYFMVLAKSLTELQDAEVGQLILQQ